MTDASNNSNSANDLAASPLLAYQNHEISADLQAMVNTPADHELDPKDVEFLTMLMSKIDKGEIDLYRPATLLNFAVYEKLSEQAQGKADVEGFNLLSTIREIRKATKRADIRYKMIGQLYHLQWGSEQAPLGTLVLSPDNVDPKIDPDWILSHNRDYFDGVRERNAIRRQTINNPDDSAIAAIEQKLLDCKRLIVELQTVFDPRGDYANDKNAILAAYGLKFPRLQEYVI